MSDSRVFFIRNFWKNERPTSTENETETENPSHPKSETKTEVSRTNQWATSGQPVQIIEDQIKSLELSKLKNENRKFEFKIKRFEAEMARLTTENDAAENDRPELAEVLLDYKARINQLESDNRQLEIKKKEKSN